MPTVSRRLFLGGVGATATGLAGCSSGGPAPAPPADPTRPGPTSATTGGSGSTQSHAASRSAGSRSPARPASHDDLLHGPRSGAAVALTFHGAGDPALTRAALHAARAAQAHLTVLAVGSWLEANHGLAQEIRAAGHELGNHTWSHLAMARLSPAAARSEVDRAAALLTRLTGSPGRWFRPSGTPRSTPVIRAAARAAGYQRCLSYDVDPLDYTDPGPAAVSARVLRQARPGSIVSLHLGHPGTIAALPHLLGGLRDRGLAAVTVSDLVKGT